MPTPSTQIDVLDGNDTLRTIYALPALGGTTAAGSLPVVLASDGPTIGPVSETAPASDTATSGLNGRLQRIAQRITSLIALFPATLGQKAKAAAMAVTLASDEDLLTNLGGLTEAVPASDTASSGLNGRLQRIAQRLTSLIALVPASLGQKAKAASFAVALASDDDLVAAIGAISATPAANTLQDRLRLLGPTTTTYRFVSSAASTNGAIIKNSPGVVQSIDGYNARASTIYLRLYDISSGLVVGTSTIRKSVLIPQQTRFTIDWPKGLSFGAGIAIAFTAGAADNDATNIAAADIQHLNVDYT